MTALCNTGFRIARFKINNDRDIQYVLGQAVDKSEVYVTILPSQQPIQLPIQQHPLSLPNSYQKNCMKQTTKPFFSKNQINFIH